MKKTITLSLVLAASLGLAACGEKKADEAATTEATAEPEAAADGAMDAAAGAADAAAAGDTAAATDKAAEAADAAKAAAGEAKTAVEEAKK